MLFKKKKVTFPVEYNPEKQIPVIHSSICTGEQTAGFKNIENHHFTEVICIKNEQDLKDFIEYYHLEDREIKKEY